MFKKYTKQHPYNFFTEFDYCEVIKGILDKVVFFFSGLSLLDCRI